MEKISICFCINDLYSQHLGVVLTSILFNNPDNFFDFYIFSSDISKKNKHTLNTLNNKYKNFNLHFINVNKNLFKNIKLTIDYISIETYFRYILADLLPDLNKVLYLDVDLVVNGNLQNLWNTNINDFYCAGIDDINFNTKDYKQTIDLDTEDTYINAGVILFNLEKIRKNNITKQYFLNNEKYKDKIKYQDQDIINITLKKQIKKIDYIFNFTSKTRKIYKNLTKNAIIIHYVGPRKPWKVFSLNTLKILYYYYLSLSPYNKYNIFIKILLQFFYLINYKHNLILRQK